MQRSKQIPLPTPEKKNEKPKTVILWGREDLLVLGFETYLKHHLDWDVIRISDNEGSAALIQKMKTLKPDVILIHPGCSPAAVRSAAARLPVILDQAQPGSIVITFGLDDNLAEVYTKQQLVITEISDLITILAHHSTSEENNHG